MCLRGASGTGTTRNKMPPPQRDVVGPRKAAERHGQIRNVITYFRSLNLTRPVVPKSFRVQPSRRLVLVCSSRIRLVEHQSALYKGILPHASAAFSGFLCDEYETLFLANGRKTDQWNLCSRPRSPTPRVSPPKLNGAGSYQSGPARERAKE